MLTRFLLQGVPVARTLFPRLVGFVLLSAGSSAQTPDPGRKKEKSISTAAGLLKAIQDDQIGTIAITADLAEVPAFTLLPGQTLSSVSGQRFALTFTPGVDGIRLTSDNYRKNISTCPVDFLRTQWYTS